MKSCKRELRALLEYAQQHGWDCRLTSNGHYRLAGPDGALVFTGSTPSDMRSVRNARAQLRRHGLPR